MERTDDRTLKQAECAFDAVRVNVAAHVFASRRDSTVSCVVFAVADAPIRGQFVGHDALADSAHVRPDETVERFAVRPCPVRHANLAVTLNAPQHHRLCCSRPAAPLPRRACRRCRFRRTSMVPRQRFGIRVSHGLADAVAEIPRGLVRHAQHPLHLVCAHTLLRFAHQEDRHEPLRQRQVRVVEDGARRDREAVAACIAVELLARR